MRQLLTILFAGITLAASADNRFATRVRADIDTTGRNSLRTLEWLQGSTPLIAVEQQRLGRTIAPDTNTMAVLKFAETPTASYGVAITNAIVDAQAYYIQAPTIGTNTAGRTWWYSVEFLRDNRVYWTGGGRLVITATTLTGDGLVWQKFSSGDWGQVIAEAAAAGSNYVDRAIGDIPPVIESDPVAVPMINVHASNTANPHGVTAAQVGALTAETDPVTTPRVTALEARSNDWNTAYTHSQTAHGVTDDGGFQGGTDASAAGGGAVGYYASAFRGGAVGHGASSDYGNGGAVGFYASASAGGAVGYEATAQGGGAVGASASAYHGGAVGSGASAYHGGAVGFQASAIQGGAVGFQASTKDGDGGAVGYEATANNGGAVGAGATATEGGAVGAYTSAGDGGAVGYSASATYGGAVGNYASVTYGGAVGSLASATYGGAVGNAASANDGGAIGESAKTGDGFAGGKQATTINTLHQSINAIQLGTGNNPNPNTLRVYGWDVLNAQGNILYDRVKKAFNEREPVIDIPVVNGTATVHMVEGIIPEYHVDEDDDFVVVAIPITPNTTRSQDARLLIQGYPGKQVTFSAEYGNVWRGVDGYADTDVNEVVLHQKWRGTNVVSFLDEVVE